MCLLRHKDQAFAARIKEIEMNHLAAHAMLGKRKGKRRSRVVEIRSASRQCPNPLKLDPISVKPPIRNGEIGQFRGERGGGIANGTR